MSRSRPSRPGLARNEAEALQSELENRLLARMNPTFVRGFRESSPRALLGVSLGLTKVGPDRFRVALRHGKVDALKGRGKVRLAETVRDVCRALGEQRSAVDPGDVSDLALGASGGCSAHSMWYEPASRSYRHRAVPVGAPIAPELCWADFGSAGVYLKHHTSGELRLLTCSHVVQEAIDEPPTGNRYILQAPRSLGGHPAPHRFANLDAAHGVNPMIVNPPETALLKPLTPGGTPAGAPNRFLRPPPYRPLRNNGVTGLNGIETNYEPWWYHPSDQLHRFVYKVGARTGWTAGTIRSVLAQRDVRTATGLIHFAGPILEIVSAGHSMFARCCDSGAPVINSEGHVLGVIFAVSRSLGTAYAFAIGPVMATWPDYGLA